MKIKTEKWDLNHSVPEVPLNPFTAFPLRRKMGFLFDAISKTVPSQKWMVFPKSLSREKKTNNVSSRWTAERSTRISLFTVRNI